MSPTYRDVTKLFLESEFQHKGNKRKDVNSQQNLAGFLRRNRFRKSEYLNTTQKRIKKIFGQNCHH